MTWQDAAGVPMSDELELELRSRLTLLEDRVGTQAWQLLLVTFLVAGVAFAALLDSWKKGKV